MAANERQGRITAKGETETYSNIAVVATLIAVTTSPSRIYDLDVVNADTADRFIQIFDLEATPVLATTIPDLVYMIPAAADATHRGSLEKTFGTMGLLIKDTLWIAVTTLAHGNLAPTTPATVNIVWEAQ